MHMMLNISVYFIIFSASLQELPGPGCIFSASHSQPGEPLKFGSSPQSAQILNFKQKSSKIPIRLKLNALKKHTVMTLPCVPISSTHPNPNLNHSANRPYCAIETSGYLIVTSLFLLFNLFLILFWPLIQTVRPLEGQGCATRQNRTLPASFFSPTPLCRSYKGREIEHGFATFVPLSSVKDLKWKRLCSLPRPNRGFSNRATCRNLKLFLHLKDTEGCHLTHT